MADDDRADGRSQDMDGVSGGLVVAAASMRTPPTKPWSTADVGGGAGVDIEGIFAQSRDARGVPTCT
jgi:hypothetical protein